MGASQPDGQFSSSPVGSGGYPEGQFQTAQPQNNHQGGQYNGRPGGQYHDDWSRPGQFQPGNYPQSRPAQGQGGQYSGAAQNGGQYPDQYSHTAGPTRPGQQHFQGGPAQGSHNQGSHSPPGHDQNGYGQPHPGSQASWTPADHFGNRQAAPAPQNSQQRPQTPPGGRGRGGWIATMTAVVVLAAATGIGSVLYWQHLKNGETEVTDKDDVITLTASNDFGSNLFENGWAPNEIGLKGKKAAGLLLASTSEKETWLDLTSDVNGVFVGATTDTSLVTKVKAIDHDGCDNSDPVTYKGNPDWTATIVTWSDCEGADHTVQEIALKPTDDSAERWVYMQVRRKDNVDRSKSLIDGLTVQQPAG